MRLRLFIAGIAAMACLIVPASAVAQSLSNDAYSSQGGQVLGAVDSGNDTTPPSATVAAVEPAPAAAVEAQSASSSTLPFTGFQAGIVAAVGIGLLGGGLVLWRANRSPRRHTA